MKQKTSLEDKLWAYDCPWKDSGASDTQIHCAGWVQHFNITWSLQSRYWCRIFPTEFSSACSSIWPCCP